MDELATLQFADAVSTEGTNWEFIGSPTHPSWENSETDHILAIFPAETGYDFRLCLNHRQQLRPWWTVTELDFAAELIPIVEWVLSTADEDLFHRELVAVLLEPFWSRQSPTDAPSKKPY